MDFNPFISKIRHPSNVRNLKPWLGVATVVSAAATAPIVIRFAQGEGLPSPVIIMLRLWLTSIGLAPWIFWKHREELRRLVPRDWAWLVFASGVHALNLTLLFFSLEYTSVLVSTVLRQTSPLWVLLMEILFFQLVFSPLVWLGALFTVTGAVLVGFGGGGIESGAQPLLGGGLALLNAVMNGVYLLIGRHLRSRIRFLPYSWVVFTGAALITTLVVVFLDYPVTGYSLRGYFLVFLVTVIAQVFGHIPINAVLHYFPATLLSISLQASVVAAAVLAFFLLGEVPAGLQVAGSILILLGVVLALRGRSP